MTTILASDIGWFARQILGSNKSGTVWGNTSKGIFVKFFEKELVFLSYESSRGPFTINIPESANVTLRELDLGTKVEFIPSGTLWFGTLGLKIALDGLDPWKPAPYSNEITPSILEKNLEQLTKWITDSVPQGSFSAICMEIATSANNLEESQRSLREYLENIARSFKDHDKDAFINSSQRIIGFGFGLTPSGDDFLMGMALGVARYSDRIVTLRSFLNWFTELSPHIFSGTTLLSSNLFNAALQGSADERLINVFDSIINDELDRTEIISATSSWGSSSGFDATSGFMLFMKAVIHE